MRKGIEKTVELDLTSGNFEFIVKIIKTCSDKLKNLSQLKIRKSCDGKFFRIVSNFTEEQEHVAELDFTAEITCDNSGDLATLQALLARCDRCTVQDLQLKGLQGGVAAGAACSLHSLTLNTVNCYPSDIPSLCALLGNAS